MASALIVDPDVKAAQSLSRILARFGIQSRHVTVPGEVADALADQVPDLIFMDSVMPGSGGYEAVKSLKSVEATAAVPVIMYATPGNEVLFGQARALGAADVLVKPASRQDIDAMLQRFRDRGIADIEVTEPEPEEASVLAAVAEPEAGPTANPWWPWLFAGALLVVLVLWFQLQSAQQRLDRYQQLVIWSFNESGQYAFGETPLAEERQRRLLELVRRMESLGISGELVVTEYSGLFCQSRLGRGNAAIWVLADDETALGECLRIGPSPAMEGALAERERARLQSRLNSVLADSELSVTLAGLSDAAPTAYPARDPLLPVGNWNEVALANNRVVVALTP